MARAYSRTLLKEDWSSLPTGPLHRDNTARGEYMAMTVPSNSNGWYHNCNAGPGVDRDHSRMLVKAGRAGRTVVMPKLVSTWGSAVVLTTGPKPWKDLRITAEVTVKGFLPVGVVARYHTNRDFYAAIFESGVFKIVRMFEGTITVLDSVVVTVGAKPMAVSLLVEGDRLEAKAAGVTLSAHDGCIVAGGIGLWANGPAAFGPVRVKTTKAEVARIEGDGKRSALAVAAKRRALPAMELLADIDVRGYAIGRQMRFADLNGDGRSELLMAVPTTHQGRKWQYGKIAQLAAMDLDGNVLWKRGKVQPDSTDITADMPFQAADRGEGMEVLAAFGPRLEVIDPLTGKATQKVPTPKTAKMEPYWDEISMYWGDGHHDDVPRLIPDCMRLCNFTGRAPYGDLFLKDRYHNVWALDGKSFKVLWHHRCNTGHYPYACDLNGDGLDEVLLGYSRVDSKGHLIGRLYLGDHPDACFSYVDCHGLRHNLHPCGEAGFVDEYGYGVGETHLGHVQHLSIGNFIPDRPDLERIIITYHGNEGIVVMMDMDDRLIRKVERYAAGAVCQPVNWTGDGRELIAFSARHGDGGLWDENFDLVVPFPNDDRPGKYMEVHDVLGLGVDQLIVWDERRLHVYGPAAVPKRRGRRYDPIRPGPNLSNYQVNYSLPRWT